MKTKKKSKKVIKKTSKKVTSKKTSKKAKRKNPTHAEKIKEAKTKYEEAKIKLQKTNSTFGSAANVADYNRYVRAKERLDDLMYSDD